MDEPKERKSKNLKEAASHLKEEAIRRYKQRHRESLDRHEQVVVDDMATGRMVTPSSTASPGIPEEGFEDENKESSGDKSTPTSGKVVTPDGGKGSDPHDHTGVATVASPKPPPGSKPGSARSRPVSAESGKGRPSSARSGKGQGHPSAGTGNGQDQPVTAGSGKGQGDPSAGSGKGQERPESAKSGKDQDHPESARSGKGQGRPSTTGSGQSQPSSAGSGKGRPTTTGSGNGQGRPFVWSGEGEGDPSSKDSPRPISAKDSAKPQTPATNKGMRALHGFPLHTPVLVPFYPFITSYHACI